MFLCQMGNSGLIGAIFQRTVSAYVKTGAMPRCWETVTRGTASVFGTTIGVDESVGGVE